MVLKSAAVPSCSAAALVLCWPSSTIQMPNEDCCARSGNSLGPRAHSQNSPNIETGGLNPHPKEIPEYNILLGDLSQGVTPSSMLNASRTHKRVVRSMKRASSSNMTLSEGIACTTRVSHWPAMAVDLAGRDRRAAGAESPVPARQPARSR
jgi:hypothetical protein